MTLNTRERILDAFFELAEKHPTRTRFTFTEIAKQAGLSRQAIYKRHFNNAEEIIEFVHRDLTKEFAPGPFSQQKQADSDPFLAFAQTVIPALYKNRDRLKILYTTAIDPNWKSFILASLQDWIDRNLQINSQKLGFPKEMASHLWATWLAALIEDWILQPQVIAPQDFAEIFLNLVSSPLTSFAIYQRTGRSADKILIAKPTSKKPRP